VTIDATYSISQTGAGSGWIEDSGLYEIDAAGDRTAIGSYHVVTSSASAIVYTDAGTMEKDDPSTGDSLSANFSSTQSSGQSMLLDEAGDYEIDADDTRTADGQFTLMLGANVASSYSETGSKTEDDADSSYSITVTGSTVIGLVDAGDFADDGTTRTGTGTTSLRTNVSSSFSFTETSGTDDGAGVTTATMIDSAGTDTATSLDVADYIDDGTLRTAEGALTVVTTTSSFLHADGWSTTTTGDAGTFVDDAGDRTATGEMTGGEEMTMNFGYLYACPSEITKAKSTDSDIDVPIPIRIDSCHCAM
jgi:hypothetical protein